MLRVFCLASLGCISSLAFQLKFNNKMFAAAVIGTAINTPIDPSSLFSGSTTTGTGIVSSNPFIQAVHADTRCSACNTIGLVKLYVLIKFIYLPLELLRNGRISDLFPNSSKVVSFMQMN